MSKQIQLVVVVPKDKYPILVEQKRLDAVDTMPKLHPAAKKVIRDFVKGYTGFEKDPIACLSRFHGRPGAISHVQLRVREVLTTTPGTTMWELHMPDDMVVSVNFNMLTSISSQMWECEDEMMLEFMQEDLQEQLVKGYLEDDDVVSFIPFIDLKRCRFVAKVDNAWGMENLSVPGVEQVKLFDINIF